MPALTVIHGECDSKFSRVREAFEAHFEKRKELGAAVAVTIEGCPVVDLWAGYADPVNAPGSGSKTPWLKCIQPQKG